MIKEMLILPFQTFFDSRFGKVEHGKRIAEQLKKNFDVVPYPVPVLLSHKSDGGKYGEVKALKVLDQGLAADIEFNEDGEKLIKSGRYDFLSPAYHENYINKRTGQGVGETLMEVSLTPIPAQPGMQRIMLSEPDGDQEVITWNVPIKQDQRKDVKTMAESTEMAVIKGYEEKIADLKSQQKSFEERMKAHEAEMTKQFDEQIKEKDNQIKQLSDDLKTMKSEKHVMHVQQWSDGWLAKSKAPAMVKMLAEKLAADPEQESFFDSLLETSSNVPTKRLVGFAEAEEAPKGVNIEELAKNLATEVR